MFEAKIVLFALLVIVLFYKFFIRKDHWWTRIMTGAQYAEFERKIRERFETEGLEYEVQEDGSVKILSDHPLTQMNLHNMAAECAQLEPEQWDECLDHYFNQAFHMKETMAEIEARLKDYDAIKDMLAIRMQHADYLKSIDEMSEGQGSVVYWPIAEDLIATLVIDMPDSLMAARKDMLESWGKTEEEIYEVAIANTDGLIDDENFQVVKDDDNPVLMISGESFFCASYCLLLSSDPELLVAGGALIAMPSRHVCMIAPIKNAEAMNNLGDMLQAAESIFEESAGAITPSLYWYYEDEFQRIELEKNDETMQLELRGPQTLGPVLQQLQSSPESSPEPEA